MDLGKLTNQIASKLKDATINYQPDPNTLNENKNKIIYGLAAIGGSYILPGEHPVLAAVTISYTAIKGYQAIKDWAEK